MFGRSKPVVFDRYARSRPRRRVPPWLAWLLTGTVAGAGGVIYLQERHLPPRLSQSDSAALRQAYDEAHAERERLRAQLADTQKQLSAALSDKKNLSAEVDSQRHLSDDLRADVASLVATLPPDPRDNGVEVRAGRFNANGNTLDYDVVLTRERTGGKPFSGVLQLVVAGDATRGGSSTINAQPVPITIQGHDIVRGSVTLPEGFKPRQTTVQVLDRAAGKPLGMRVLLVGK